MNVSNLYTGNSYQCDKMSLLSIHMNVSTLVVHMDMTDCLYTCHSYECLYSCSSHECDRMPIYSTSIWLFHMKDRMSLYCHSYESLNTGYYSYDRMSLH